MREEIVRAAIQLKTGEVISLPAPMRHHHIIAHMHKMGVCRLGSKQGFLTNMDRFVDRKEAATIARLTGKVRSNIKVLFSEDLW